ncbi:hypothetical protein R0K17_20910, partial [Planococcus sp. SIMBA_143]
NNAASDYRDEKYPNDKTLFQVPVDGAYSLFNSFIPKSEAEYSFKTTADADLEQKEFENYGSNEQTSTFDVVDMRNPSANARQNILNRRDTNTFDLSITQKYTQ